MLSFSKISTIIVENSLIAKFFTQISWQNKDTILALWFAAHAVFPVDDNYDTSIL